MAGTSVCQHYGEGRNGTLCSTSKIKFDKVPGVEAKTSSNEERGGSHQVKGSGYFDVHYECVFSL